VTDFAQTVKQQADIVKVIEQYIRLRKAGAVNYSGLCPFHKEKSPSFSVHAVRQFYHCFGCGAKMRNPAAQKRVLVAGRGSRSTHAAQAARSPRGCGRVL
jgi:hypothetical protein